MHQHEPGLTQQKPGSISNYFTKALQSENKPPLATSAKDSSQDGLEAPLIVDSDSDKRSTIKNM